MAATTKRPNSLATAHLLALAQSPVPEGRDLALREGHFDAPAKIYQAPMEPLPQADAVEAPEICLPNREVPREHRSPVPRNEGNLTKKHPFIGCDEGCGSDSKTVTKGPPC
ncbi:hypothetical protein PGT21_005955 [Puccinia graminis f. sp. tritici]|uniref:Uncharacterized protein n=1 Tax=Puccinia graminis f. sp. tritici TaxID=56615 RepID=A0A5B0MEC7_PUCGR|nr:hypothetical protein PGT21_005955 [Puccinia graminis f. sp. tritici]